MKVTPWTVLACLLMVSLVPAIAADDEEYEPPEDKETIVFTTGYQDFPCVTYRDAGDEEAQLSVGSGRVRYRVGPGRNVRSLVAEHHVLAGPVSQRIPDRSEPDLDDAVGPWDPIGHDELDVLAGREQLGLGVVGPELDLDDARRRLGHAHQPVALVAVGRRQRHVEDDPLVDLAVEDPRLALTAGPGPAVVGQHVAGPLERAQDGVAAPARDLFARRRQADDGRSGLVEDAHTGRDIRRPG